MEELSSAPLEPVLERIVAAPVAQLHLSPVPGFFRPRARKNPGTGRPCVYEIAQRRLH